LHCTSTSDAKNAAESSARSMAEKHIDAIGVSRSIRFIASNMILYFQTPKQDGCFL